MSAALVSRLASASLEDRHIPHEVLQRIFSHCDTSTLAIIARTNLASLELSYPFLYTDIVLHDLKKALVLARINPELEDLPQSDRISPYTSLDAVHSVTFHAKDGLATLNHNFPPKMVPIPIHVLALTLPPMRGPDPLEIEMFLDLFNPSYLLVEGRKTPHIRLRSSTSGLASLPVFDFASDSSMPPYWDRLRVVVLTNAVLNSETSGKQGISSVVKRCTEGRGRSPIRVFHDLVGASDEGVAAVVENAYHLTQVLSDPNSDCESSRLELELRLWVATEKMKVKLDRFTQGMVGEDGKKWVFVDARSARATNLLKESSKGLRKGLDWAALEE